MDKRSRPFLAGAGIVLGFCCQGAWAAAITPGNLIVTQVGDGSAALSSAATAAFLQEITTTGTAVQTFSLPTSASGSNAILTLSGTATSEGFVTLSGNGQYLTIGGYNAAPGTASVTSSIGNRTAGRVSLSGTVDTSTVLNDAASIGNMRSVVSNDGSQFWAGSSSGGVRYTTFGSIAASTQINTAPTNTRVANIAGGQLYISSASGTFLGVATVGSGLPTTSGQTVTQLNGFPTTGSHSSYDYWFKDADTLYVADDSSAANGGGIQKWTNSGGTWSLQYTLLNSGTATVGVRGLTGTLDGGGNAVLYATTSETATRLITVTDTGAASALTALATAPASTAFRGVEFIPIPEPTSLALVGLLVGSIGLAPPSRLTFAARCHFNSGACATLHERHRWPTNVACVLIFRACSCVRVGLIDWPSFLKHNSLP